MRGCISGQLLTLLLSSPRCDVNAAAAADGSTALLLASRYRSASVVDRLLRRAPVDPGPAHDLPRYKTIDFLAQPEAVTTFSDAVSVLREASGDGSLTIRRFKDCFFTDQYKSGYRDLKVNVEVSGFVGESPLGAPFAPPTWTPPPRLRASCRGTRRRPWRRPPASRQGAARPASSSSTPPGTPAA